MCLKYVPINGCDMFQLTDMVKSSLWMFFVKIIGMGGAFLVTVVIGRNLGAEVLGEYGLALTLVAVFGMVAKFGTDKNIVKRISGFGAQDLRDRLPQFLVSYYVSAFCVCALVALIFFGAGGILSVLITGSDKNTELFQIASLAIFSNTLVATSSGIFQARKDYVLSIAAQVTMHQLVFLAVLLFSMDQINSSVSLLLCYIVANTVTLVVCLFGVKKLYVPVDFSKLKIRSYFTNGLWFHLDSRHLFSATAGGYLLGSIDILVIGYFYDSAMVGIYIVVTRVGNLVGSVLSTLNAYIAPNIAILDQNLNRSRIRQIVIMCSIFASAIASVFVFGLWVFGVEILGIFGDEFKSGYMALVFVGLAQLINAVSGPVGQVMQMTDMQPLIQKIMLVSVLLNLALNICLVPVYGIEGAALSTMLTTLLANSWQFVHVYHGYFKNV